ALYIADVGQADWEEVSYQPAGAGGRNYGWPLREGANINPHAPAGVVAAYQPLIDPFFQYHHDDGLGGSITGGHLYRGALLGPAMRGRYVFVHINSFVHHIVVSFDPSTGRPSASDRQSTYAFAPPGSSLLVSIDADLHGELFLVYLGGTVFRLTT